MGILKHGDKRRTTGTAPEYDSWSGMIGRCHNPSDKRFPYYGARGIFVCDRWRGENGYAHFLADVGRKPSPKHSIDRIDNDRGYSPDNCRWATRSEQMRNTRRTRQITIGGVTMCLKAWAQQLGIVSYKRAHARIKEGWQPERALTTPPDSRHGQRAVHRGSP